MFALPLSNHTEKTYDKPGVTPNVWGPILWNVFFHLAKLWDDGKLSLSDSQFHQWITTIAHILPCIYCRQTFTNYVANVSNPLPSIQQKTMKIWVYEAKEMVNKKLYKQKWNTEVGYVPILTFPQFQQRLVIPFCEKNAWEIMLLFTLNYDPSFPGDRKQFEKVFRLFNQNLNYESKKNLFQSIVLVSPYHKNQNARTLMQQYERCLPNKLATFPELTK